MDKAVIDLIKTGEGLTLELKEGINPDLGKEICAFANALGGKIILGVKDNGEIIGVKKTNSLMSQIQNFARKSELEILERQFKMFSPLEFARIKDVKDIVSEEIKRLKKK